MAVIRDVMPAFALYQPNSISDALKLLADNGPDALVLAGGMDSFDWLKDRIKKPRAVVDLSGIAELRGIRTVSDGIEIGAMTTLTEVVNDPTIKEKYGLLAEAAENVASPQIQIREHWAAMFLRIRAAATTATAGPAIARAGTSVMRTRRLDVIASTPFCMLSV